MLVCIKERRTIEVDIRFSDLAFESRHPQVLVRPSDRTMLQKTHTKNKDNKIECMYYVFVPGGLQGAFVCRQSRLNLFVEQLHSYTNTRD